MFQVQPADVRRYRFVTISLLFNYLVITRLYDLFSTQTCAIALMRSELCYRLLRYSRGIFPCTCINIEKQIEVNRWLLRRRSDITLSFAVIYHRIPLTYAITIGVSSTQLW